MNQKYSIYLIVSYLFLLSIGVIFVYNTTYNFSLKTTGDPAFLFKKHVIGVGIGIIVFFLFAFIISIDKLRSRLPIIFILTFISMILPFIPFLGKEFGGAQRWVSFYFFVFQPSEIAKLVIILYLSSILEKREVNIGEYTRGVVPPLIVCTIIAGITLFQKDFSTAGFIIILTLIMLYVSGAKFLHILLSLLVLIPIFVPFLITSTYRINRIMVLFDDRFESPARYQIIKSIQAISNGKIFGVGLGRSEKNIPFNFNDFIFSIIAEEMGLIGSIIIIILYFIIFKIGISIAKEHLRLNNNFYANLAFGITSLITLQALINIGVTLGIIFPTGITLPFISYGRTSLIVMSAAIGILVYISRFENKIKNQNTNINFLI
ncbi:MAG TPA: FtsW/RodA/SpoVE family cell cycle protein [Spirochaetota bacterium]|mgnify:CR=1 FL=1|nr:FtsW/RodA/SpoVE family cell cycle protein [Spirochaetota bacterium]HOM38585.1 FtsW/RodA/SpoVE family cell cycle protein [Spirochaetota bacterium]HPQ49722.1 FtsW/RodA/SpoVE family cell cycle protein [Spirochaetota bacterium]